MKVGSLIQGRISELEERKRALHRREMGEAYKKTAKFVEASKNPVLVALDNLLSGKTDKDLHAADVATKEETPDTQLTYVEQKEQQIESPQLISELLSPYKATEPMSYTNGNKHYLNSGEVTMNTSTGTTREETINILEQVKMAALAPAQPSPQDLRIAAIATAQIQQTEAILYGESKEEVEEQEPFIGEELNIDVPERFMNDFKRDAEAPTVFGKELESLLFQRTYMKATAKYIHHIAMVKNGYRSIEEPTFSKIA
ncbi:putative metalloprotease CJM1_0395 family protein [Solibacillus sp. CAU 1738]|uniref:putative metalloprotease CJM1_0395 family protein n=1 Tax=Solibacillus sp. CAU 1738 TaxID=3140363 RepID=UPI00326058A1